MKRTKDSKMTLKNRVKRLEKKAGVDQGMIYMVHQQEDGLYHFLRDERVMNEAEFAAFERSLSENDNLILITRRESAKEEEHV